MREARAAQSEPGPSAADAAARAPLQHRLVAAVLQLPEPYRQTVLLRFFEELQPREIAARMNTPVETVRTRLRRALERLRGELDSSCGGRGAWTALELLEQAAGRAVTLAMFSLTPSAGGTNPSDGFAVQHDVATTDVCDMRRCVRTRVGTTRCGDPDPVTCPRSSDRWTQRGSGSVEQRRGPANPPKRPEPRLHKPLDHYTAGPSR